MLHDLRTLLKSKAITKLTSITLSWLPILSESEGGKKSTGRSFIVSIRVLLLIRDKEVKLYFTTNQLM